MRFFLYCLILILFVFPGPVKAQDKWDLRKCVNYALANNISIKQSDIQAKIAGVQYSQTKLSQYPNANFTANSGFTNGNSQDPTTYSLITQNYISAGMQLQSSAQIFNWYSKQNATAAAYWQAEAAKASTDKLKDDIALNIANAYLQVLLMKQTAQIAAVQMEQSRAQLNNTRKLVSAGSLPELNAAEMEAQFATDSASYISANGNVTQSLLALKAYMNFDAAMPFEITEPPVELIPVEKIADLQPDAVYALALVNMPQQRANDLKLKAAINNAASLKAAMYPTLTAFANLSSSYINLGSPIYTPTGTFSSNALSPQVTIGGVTYKVSSPDYMANGSFLTPFNQQLNDNFHQSVGLSLSIPIFNGYTSRGNWQISKLQTRNTELQKDLDNQTLKQNIYQAYNAAVVALEKLNASEKNVSTSQRSYDFAMKRYQVGMLSTIELITTQNSLLSAKLQYVQNQFDYVFKMKVLEYYKGLGIKL